MFTCKDGTDSDQVAWLQVVEDPSSGNDFIFELDLSPDEMYDITNGIVAEFDLDGCREAAQQMDARIPDSSLLDMPGATHFMFLEEPEVVNTAMLEFLAEAAGR